MTPQLTAAQWSTAIEEADPPTFGEVVQVLEESDVVDADPREVVEAAIATGDVVEDENHHLRLEGAETDAEDTQTEGVNPGGKTVETPEKAGDSWGTWEGADFTQPEAGVWPPELLEREQWMGHVEKKPFAPWGDRDHPEADEDTDARWKWGLSENYVDGETVAIAEDDPRLDGRAFLQQPEDPYAYVDGDDVRDPDTGEVHPAFVEVLERLGVTYADISQSGAGVHAQYRGELPERVKQAAWQLDTEPWGANDDLPSVEIYAGKRVCVATGDHVPGSPTDVLPWDDDELVDLLDEHDQIPPEPSTDREEFDLEDYEPDATEADETTHDIRDVFAALDRLDARVVAEKTIVHRWNDDASTSEGERAFVPTWGPDANGTANIVNADRWQDTGDRGGYGGVAVIAAIDARLVSESATPADVRGKTWFRAIDHLRELGFPIPEYVDPSRDGETREYRTDPTEVDVVLEPKRAWDAAGRVTPEDLDDQPLDPQGDGWVDPRTGEVVGDVVRAVAIAEYPNVEIDTPLGDRYAEAYRVARDRFDAPLPEYLTHADAVERFDYVIGAVRELTFWHLDEDALNVEITGRGDDVSGEAELTLDPSPLDGWRESESGESVLVFPSGTVYDVDLGEDGQVVDVLRFVAVDAGLLDDPTGRLEGEDFTEAYRVAREDYGAPLPRWDAGTPDVTPILPPAEDFIDLPEEIAGATERLDELRQDTEALYRDAIEAPDEVDVLNVLPALGKTTAAIKTAADKPTTYLAARKDLMAQAAAKAEAHGASYLHLPVFAEANLEDTVVDRGVEAVRDGGMHLLRDRWNLLDAVGEEDLDIFDEGEEDEDAVELERATCPTAEGDHGDAWALAVHVAHALDYTPRDIHERAEALFGTSLPCQGDEGDQCEYSHGWDEASDPDDPIDLLIGYYTHAHVESARTYYERSQNGRTRKSPRGVVLDEFPGRSFTETFDEDALDHAVWLARALTDTVDDRQDLLERDVWDDDLVRLWLKGEAAEEGGPTHDLARSIGALRASLEAAEAAEELLDGYGDLLESRELAESVRRVRDDVVDLGREERAEIAGRIATEAGRVPPDDDAFGVLKWLDDDVATPLANSAGVEIQPDADALPEGELRRFVEDAVEAADNLADGAAGMLRALEDALAGGDDGARELSVYAGDGYAHRKAHYLLEAAVRPPQDGDVPKIATESFTFGTEDGTTLKHVRINDRVRVVLDRNSRGAEILQPFSRTAGGGDVPVVGLDATARGRLWAEAIGGDVRLRDVHDTPTERAETLREVHDLQIVQTSDLMKAYEGDPSGKNLDADVALLEEIKDKFSGVIPGDRDGEADVLGKPAAITTKVVREVLEDDERLDDAVARWENYGNLKGANDLGEHRLAALLGSQHYGDAEIERFAALAGEEIHRTGYGSTLNYRSDVANEYLRHMREDQVMQAALRFARGDSGAIVFAHTAALRDDLPVVGRGEVIRSWSETATAIAKEWRRHPTEEFTVADVADAVGVGKRQVRRVLEEFVNAGYLDRRDPGVGRANQFTPRDRPGAGEVEIGAEPDAPRAEPGREPFEVSYTANVRVTGRNNLLDTVTRGGTTPLPAPSQVEESIATGDPPS